MFDVSHVFESGSQGLITYLRIALLHAFDGLPHWQAPWRGDLQSIIVDCMKRLVFDTEHQTSALPIGERHRGFGVVDAPRRRSKLVLHILGFAVQQCFQVISPRNSVLIPISHLLRHHYAAPPLKEGLQVSEMIRFCLAKDTNGLTLPIPNLSIRFCNNSSTRHT